MVNRRSSRCPSGRDDVVNAERQPAGNHEFDLRGSSPRHRCLVHHDTVDPRSPPTVELRRMVVVESDLRRCVEVRAVESGSRRGQRRDRRGLDRRQPRLGVRGATRRERSRRDDRKKPQHAPYLSMGHRRPFRRYARGSADGVGRCAQAPARSRCRDASMTLNATDHHFESARQRRERPRTTSVRTSSTAPTATRSRVAARALPEEILDHRQVVTARSSGLHVRRTFAAPLRAASPSPPRHH